MARWGFDGRSLSFEFFPPKTDTGREKLRRTHARLAQLRPEFFSVTFGAGGSTREGTYETVREIQASGDAPAAPHISCIGASRESIRELLQAYRAIGVRRIVALRGDLPSGMVERGEFAHADELVAFIREETGDWFYIEVAAYPEFHPEAPSASADLRNFARKVAAGANRAITQYFFNPDAYFRFVDWCQAFGIGIDVVPGIMPIVNYRQLARFSEGCGAEIPRWLRWRLEELVDDVEALRAFGTDVVSAMCERLLAGGAPGLHFYTLNMAAPTLAICDRLGIDVQTPA
ncbi:MAG TPA: methylenetetrahydrofolate reductase [NAD(P)H] [Thiotrichales bacterium]|nr:methylenetetrahydrofolate reductase [NAD(P)H] [Thiotrichales bacterium]